MGRSYVQKTNPAVAISSYYAKCDGKTFGPFKTKAKAKKVAETVARVLDKPAKIYGKAKNPGRVMKAVRLTKFRRMTAPKRKRRRNPADRVVKKVGKWTIEWTNGHLRIDDGWQSSYPIYYPHNGQVAYDFPERIPKRIQAVVKRELSK